MRRTAHSSEARRSANVGNVPGGGSAGGRAPRTAGPQRTCVACRTVRAKRELVRVVRAPTGELSVDLRGKAAGRGAYLDPDPGCLERGLKDGVLAKALEITIDDATAQRLRTEMDDAARTRQQEEKR